MAWGETHSRLNLSERTCNVFLSGCGQNVAHGSQSGQKRHFSTFRIPVFTSEIGSFYFPSTAEPLSQVIAVGFLNASSKPPKHLLNASWTSASEMSALPLSRLEGSGLP